MTVASTAEYLKDLWPNELADIRFEVAVLPSAPIGSAGLDRWRVNVAEQSVAMAMGPSLPGDCDLMLADGNYDSAPLHKMLGSRDVSLLTPLKGQKRVKNGEHHPVTLRQMGPQRRAA